MDVPEGAKQPDDHQAAAVKPEKHSEAFSLLRPPIDLEFWEVTDFMSATSRMKVRGDTVELNSANVKSIGEIVRQMQTVFANNSEEFRAWLKGLGAFDKQAGLSSSDGTRIVTSRPTPATLPSRSWPVSAGTR